VHEPFSPRKAPHPSFGLVTAWCSHTKPDLPFLESAGITRWLLLAEELQETTAEEVRGLLGAPEAS
jgi:hypothetical protein